MIAFKDFVSVKNETLVEAGINQGDELFIAGSQPVQEDQEDLYNLRLKLIACTLKGDHVNTDKFYLIDAKNVEKVADDRQTTLTQILELDFTPAEGDPNATAH